MKNVKISGIKVFIGFGIGIIFIIVLGTCIAIFNTPSSSPPSKSIHPVSPPVSKNIKSSYISDVEILNWHWELDKSDYWVRVIGELKNNSNEALVVMVQAVAQDKNGIPIDTQNWLVAGSKNLLLPGTTRVFAFPFSSRESIKTVSLQVSEANKW